ncbi:uncharacterized protein METZ01_LOCUS435914 [marine metagenome]|uniref:Uncharacterized protein n=1 Tax=marine metagenome TaxID=408172 RepID=A0A382YIZ9_9ZZZZ
MHIDTIELVSSLLYALNYQDQE